MISQNPKAQTCCVKEWSRCRSTPPQRNGRRAVAGEFSVSENRSTEWTWRPLSPTRGLSAMEVSDHTFPCQCSLCVIYTRMFSFCTIQEVNSKLSVGETKYIFVAFLDHLFRQKRLLPSVTPLFPLPPFCKQTAVAFILNASFACCYIMNSYTDSTMSWSVNLFNSCKSAN